MEDLLLTVALDLEHEPLHRLAAVALCIRCGNGHSFPSNTLDLRRGSLFVALLVDRRGLPIHYNCAPGHCTARQPPATGQSPPTRPLIRLGRQKSAQPTSCAFGSDYATNEPGMPGRQTPRLVPAPSHLQNLKLAQQKDPKLIVDEQHRSQKKHRPHN